MLVKGFLFKAGSSYTFFLIKGKTPVPLVKSPFRHIENLIPAILCIAVAGRRRPGRFRKAMEYNKLLDRRCAAVRLEPKKPKQKEDQL